MKIESILSRLRFPLIERCKAISLRSDWVFLLVAPIVAVPLFGICLINQIGFNDPWIYTGYARLLKRMVEIYGWQYYSLRFPVVGLISLFSTVFSAPLDFIFLRYLIYALVAFALYHLFSKTFSKASVFAAIVTLLAAPQFARILLWDISSFVAIPAAIIGMCLWLTPTQERIATRLAAGFMFGVAINSHMFVATAVGTFLLVMLIVDCWASRWIQIVTDCAWALLGGAICVAIGLVYYKLSAPPVGLRNFIVVTIGSIQNGLDYHLRNQLGTTQILTRELPIYLPVILTAMNGVLLGRRIFSTAISARVFWFSAAYVSLFVLFHFVGGRNLLGFFFYVAFMFPTVILQIPIVVDELGDPSRPGVGWNAATAFITCLVIIPLLNNWIPQVSSAFLELQYSSLQYSSLQYSSFLFAVLALAAAALALAMVSSRAKFAGFAAAVMLALAIQVTLFANIWQAQAFSRSHWPREFAVYLAALDLVRLARDHDVPGHRLRIWYPRDDTTMSAMSFVIYGSTVQPPESVYETGMPSIGEWERKVLASPDSGYVLLTANTDEMVDAGLAALQSAGVQYDLQMKTTLGTHPAYRIKAVLVSLRH